MEPLYNVNGLMFWSEEEIRLRRFFENHFCAGITLALSRMNSAWRSFQVEAPLLTPRHLLNKNYTVDDIWEQPRSGTVAHPNMVEAEIQILALRPETTPGSYVYARHLLESHDGHKPPLCVWQVGKSFRREQDQVTKNMRLKEFYQQEFQCIYTADSANDYHTAMQGPVQQIISEMVKLPTRLVTSDRLPSYSEITVDVEVDNGDKWMEVCSISRRTDFGPIRFSTPKGIVEKPSLVLEVAIGLDRCIYNWMIGAGRVPA